MHAQKSVQDIHNSLPSNVFLMRAYGALSKMSAMGEYLTHKAGYMRGGEGGLSRSAQYLRFLISQMEQLRMIKIYRCGVICFCVFWCVGRGASSA